jgi:hypothetical protein
VPPFNSQVLKVAAAADAPVAGVSLELAAARARQILELRYRLSLELTPGAEQLKGREEIRLRLMSVPTQLVLDYRDLDQKGKSVEGTVSDVTANGQVVSDLRQANGHLLIPGHLPQDRRKQYHAFVHDRHCGGRSPAYSLPRPRRRRRVRLFVVRADGREPRLSVLRPA